MSEKSVMTLLRERNKLTQEQVAKELGITQTAVSQWETGSCFPKLENLVKLSEIYHCSVDELLAKKTVNNGQEEL